jgi:hypothetical protein
MFRVFSSISGEIVSRHQSLKAAEKAAKFNGFYKIAEPGQDITRRDSVAFGGYDSGTGNWIAYEWQSANQGDAY